MNFSLPADIDIISPLKTTGYNEERAFQITQWEDADGLRQQWPKMDLDWHNGESTALFLWPERGKHFTVCKTANILMASKEWNSHLAPRYILPSPQGQGTSTFPSSLESSKFQVIQQKKISWGHKLTWVLPLERINIAVNSTTLRIKVWPLGITCDSFLFYFFLLPVYFRVHWLLLENIFF